MSNLSSLAPPAAWRGHAVSEPRGLIAGYGVLGMLPERDLAELMHRSTIRVLRRRDILFRQGDPGSTVTLVLRGYVKLSKTLVDGRDVVLEIVGAGEALGEVAVLNKWAHEADATALSDCRLLSIDGRHFRRTFDSRPECLLTIMRLVSERLQRMTEQMVDALALSAQARLAKAIMLLARLRAANLGHGGKVRLTLSQTELGAMTGPTRESVNKNLGAWREAGWILLSDRSVTLIDVRALSDIALG
jgi:CRP-like cAMP-binding protein